MGDYRHYGSFIVKPKFEHPWTPKLSYHFLKRAQFSENFDSNI